MRKILLFISFIFITHIGFSQYITGIDNADNYSQNDYPGEGNLGTGFGSWASSNTDGGWFLGDATNNGASNSSILNTNGNAFGMWATNFSDVGRNFSSLNTGDKLSFSFSFQWDNGNKGFDLYTGGVGTGQVFNLNLNSATGYTWTNGGSQAMTSWDVAPGDRQNGVVISVVITQTATGLDYDIQAAAGDGGFGTKTGSITFSGNINAIKFYVSGAGGAGGNLYFNNLQIEVADPANVPAAADVVINGNVDLAVDESLSCSNLTISGINSLTLKSDATGTASLLPSGTVTGNVSVERYLSSYTSPESDDGWHFLSAPVAAQAISSFHTPGSGDDFYMWDEPTGYWINRTAEGGGENVSFDDDFIVGKGYLVAYSSISTKTFSGTLNNAQVVKNLSYEGPGAYKGYNLLGNPFATAIDWDEITKSASVNGEVHVYKESLGDYVSYNAGGDLTDGIIPAMQGFMVLATASSQSLTIDLDDRLISTQNYYKNTESELMKISVKKDADQTNLYLRFNKAATNGFDSEWDAHKIFGFSAVPKIFAYDENTKYSINSLPSEQTTHIVDIGIRTVDSEEYTLSFSDISEASGLYSNIQLEDRANGSWIEIEEGTLYNFISEEGDNMDRFKLHFGATGINEIQKEALQAYVSGDQLYILGEEGTADLVIYNLQGQELYNKQVKLNAQYSQSLDLNTGIYLVSLQTKTATKTAKVIIK